MPKKFDKCAKKGGKVRTVTKGSQKGKKICFEKGSGKARMGYRHSGRKK